MKLLLALVLLAVPTFAGAQQYRASILYVAPEGVPGDSVTTAHPSVPADSLPLRAPGVPEVRQPDLVFPISVGVVGAVAGAAAGIAIGASSDDYYGDIPEGAIFGYLVGETLCMPLGVHFGNQRHGSFAGDLGLSLLGHLASLAIASIGGNTAGYAIGMAGTLAVTVANERAVGRRRLTEQAQRP